MPTPPAATAAPPSPWVERHARLLAPGARVLDVAAGSGRHARLLRRLGHPVTAVDRDTAGLTDLVADCEVVAADLEGAPWPFAGRRFGGIVVTNYLHRPLLPRLADALEPDGVLIYETFAAGNEAHGRPSNPDFLLRDNELLEAFAGRLTVVAYQHGLDQHPRPAVRQRIVALGRGRDAGTDELAALS